MPKFYVFVNAEENSLKVCRALSKNIRQINDAGVYVVIKKVSNDAATVENLRRIGVKQVPSMTTPSGQVINGTSKILAVFQDVVETGYHGEGPGRGSAIESSNPEDVLENMRREEFRLAVNQRESGAANEEEDVGEEKWNPSEAVLNYVRANPRHNKPQNEWQSDDNRPGAGRQTAERAPAEDRRQAGEPNGQLNGEFVEELEDNDADTEMLLRQMLG